MRALLALLLVAALSVCTGSRAGAVTSMPADWCQAQIPGCIACSREQLQPAAGAQFPVAEGEQPPVEVVRCTACAAPLYVLNKDNENCGCAAGAGSVYRNGTFVDAEMGPVEFDGWDVSDTFPPGDYNYPIGSGTNAPPADATNSQGADADVYHVDGVDGDEEGADAYTHYAQPQRSTSPFTAPKKAASGVKPWGSLTKQQVGSKAGIGAVAAHKQSAAQGEIVERVAKLTALAQLAKAQQQQQQQQQQQVFGKVAHVKTPAAAADGTSKFISVMDRPVETQTRGQGHLQPAITIQRTTAAAGSGIQWRTNGQPILQTQQPVAHRSMLQRETKGKRIHGKIATFLDSLTTPEAGLTAGFIGAADTSDTADNIVDHAGEANSDVQDGHESMHAGKAPKFYIVTKKGVKLVHGANKNAEHKKPGAYKHGVHKKANSHGAAGKHDNPTVDDADEHTGKHSGPGARKHTPHAYDKPKHSQSHSRTHDTTERKHTPAHKPHREGPKTKHAQPHPHPTHPKHKHHHNKHNTDPDTPIYDDSGSSSYGADSWITVQPDQLVCGACPTGYVSPGAMIGAAFCNACPDGTVPDYKKQTCEPATKYPGKDAKGNDDDNDSDGIEGGEGDNSDFVDDAQDFNAQHRDSIDGRTEDTRAQKKYSATHQDAPAASTKQTQTAKQADAVADADADTELQYADSEDQGEFDGEEEVVLIEEVEELKEDGEEDSTDLTVVTKQGSSSSSSRKTDVKTAPMKPDSSNGVGGRKPAAAPASGISRPAGQKSFPSPAARSAPAAQQQTKPPPPTPQAADSLSQSDQGADVASEVEMILVGGDMEGEIQGELEEEEVEYVDAELESDDGLLLDEDNI